MKKIKTTELKVDEDYLVFVGYWWSPSGFDIGNYELSGVLRSYSTGDNLLEKTGDIKIYKLPTVKECHTA